ncbi:hypothetical protein EGI22_20545 [Lacihabitans sp. LS3-19]|uniref:hypothetical protein n=1 Tax=Lacihabitans sp. LS3-19 TaxID=2487335 RepID=UPI0020CF5013|nr:hypothetical protein [Lacihabitans sp. LS3-19]MCP9770302.1 hypothetical protein [Lacihabitans sp. LS3-19]
MKRAILSLTICLVFTNLWANENFTNPVSEEEFSQINKIEAFVEANPQTTLADLKNKDSELIQGIDLMDNTDAVVNSAVKDMPLLSGFWWGCCLGVVGLALVYFITDKDRDQTRKALIGCLIATLVWGVGGLINPFGW